MYPYDNCSIGWPYLVPVEDSDTQRRFEVVAPIGRLKNTSRIAVSRIGKCRDCSGSISTRWSAVSGLVVVVCAAVTAAAAAAVQPSSAASVVKATATTECLPPYFSPSPGRRLHDDSNQDETKKKETKVSNTRQACCPIKEKLQGTLVFSQYSNELSVCLSSWCTLSALLPGPAGIRDLVDCITPASTTLVRVSTHDMLSRMRGPSVEWTLPLSAIPLLLFVLLWLPTVLENNGKNI